MRLIKVLEGPTAKYLPTTGVMLVSNSAAALYESLTKAQPGPDQQDELITFTHEHVHHLQVLSSSYLWLDAVARVDASTMLLYPKHPHDRASAAFEIARRERAWRCRAFGVSVADLCEGTAVLESYKAWAAHPTATEFLEWRNFAFPGKGNSVYRRTFDILTRECSAEAAFDLLPVLTFLALQCDIPGRAFEILLRHARIKSGELAGATASTVLDAVEMAPPPIATLTPHTLANMHPRHQHPTLYPVLQEAIRELGNNALETFARPHRAASLPLRTSLLPPIIVGAHRQGGQVSLPFGAAAANKELRLQLLLYTAVVAAARRIATGTEDYIACPHKECPNYDGLLCAGWVVPPPEPELCRFRAEIRNLQGKDLHEIAAECVPIVETDRFVQLRSTSDLAALFPDAAQMPEICDDENETCAGRFDQHHLLDPEDNDCLLMSTCHSCGLFSQEWASRRKMDRGFVAACPKCGELQDIQTDRVFNVEM